MSISKQKQLFINMMGNIIVFITNIAISFFLTPYIVKNIGVEANGFVTLANNFISYASIITIAVNSMAARFITIKYINGDYDEANSYYTSVLIGNLTIAVVLFIPAIMIVAYLEKLINIPTDLIFDVKLLFSFIFLNFFITTSLPNWATCFFLKNKIYLQSIGTILTSILRVALLVLAFAFFDARVFYVGMVASIVTLCNQLWSVHYKKKLVPDLKIKKQSFKMNYLVELISSGIWNSITQLGTLLLSGLDLLIANLFLGPMQMGVLSIVKIIPNTISSLASALSGVFCPALTIEYAKGNFNEILKELKMGMKITTALLTILLSAVIVWGKEFFSLWQPTQDAYMLQILSILCCLSFMVSNSIQVLYNVFSVVNKLKPSALAVLIGGILSTVITYIMLKTTNLGIFAIAATSSVLNVIRHIVFTIPYTAKCLNFKWTTFFPGVFLSFGIIACHIVIGIIIKQVAVVDSWLTLIIWGGVFAIVCFVFNVIVVLNKQQRQMLFKKLTRNKLQ